ncbi:MAG TPA: hypothetical protein VLQ45_32835 [Thermoanaerobaculia bacterium]|nr:hypothetical protein [Thermoanaerobaculia bacterium]
MNDGPLRPPVVFNVVAEGDIDETVLRRLVLETGAVPGRVHGRNGRSKIKNQIQAYNRAARFDHWLVLIDLDRDECPASLRALWLPEPAGLMCFRIAVRAVESWLLADREAIAGFLGIALSKVPHQPDAEINPKRALIDLARSSRSEIRRDLVPHPESGRTVGPGYSSRMKDYITNHWRPEVAAESSDSLRRSRLRIGELARRG